MLFFNMEEQNKDYEIEFDQDSEEAEDNTKNWWEDLDEYDIKYLNPWYLGK